MFCHKCGAQMVEGAAFCPKCGTKAVHTDDNQQPMNTATPIVEPQQADAEVPPIAENTKRTADCREHQTYPQSKRRPA